MAARTVPTLARRVPKQERSRRLVAAVLDGAEEVLAEHGIGAATMSAVAERAGVPIASVYQYFPDLRAVVWGVFERFHAETRAWIADLADGFEPARVDEQLIGAVIDYYRRISARPGMRAIWTAVESDPDLAEYNLADSRVNASVLAAALRDLRPELSLAELERRCLLVAQLTGAAVTTAITAGDREGEELIRSFATIVAEALTRSDVESGECRCGRS